MDIYTGGHAWQVYAQFLYGYGYSTPFGFEFVSPLASCGLKDFEAAIAQYDFLNNPDQSQGKKYIFFYFLETAHKAKLDWRALE